MRTGAPLRCIAVGTSGSGKSTFARAAATAMGVRHVELDDHFWSENWTPRPTEEFIESVRRAAMDESWVADGNYSVVRGELWPRATHIIWLNFSRAIVFSRVLWRTIRRVAFRQKLWHGNCESFRKAFFSRESILLWSFSTYSKNQEKYAKLKQDSKFAHLSWVEFTSPAQARAFLSDLRQTDA